MKFLIKTSMTLGFIFTIAAPLSEGASVPQSISPTYDYSQFILVRGGGERGGGRHEGEAATAHRRGNEAGSHAGNVDQQNLHNNNTRNWSEGGWGEGLGGVAEPAIECDPNDPTSCPAS